MNRTSMSRAVWWLVPLALLAACTSERITTSRSSDSTEPAGTVDTLTTEVESSPIGWTSVGEDPRVQIGSLEVPIDHADASKGTFDLYLARHLADPGMRIGSLLVNPGGPGFGGSDFAIYAESVYSKTLLDRFDIVGWDPRGTGLSEPAIDCTDDYDHFFAGTDITPDTPDAEQQIEAVNAVLDECGKDTETLARLLQLGHLDPHTHRVHLPYTHPVHESEPERHCSLLWWAFMGEWDHHFELIALLLMRGADADAQEEFMENRTPREFARERLEDRYMANREKQFSYILILMGEPSNDYPVKWGLNYAAGKGYFYGVQRLARTVGGCEEAIKHNEVELEKAKAQWDKFYFVRNDPEECTIWFDDLAAHIRILERIREYLVRS